MKTHSREWFLRQVADAKKSIDQWPDWMKEGKRVATASFPQVGPDQKRVTTTLGEKKGTNRGSEASTK